MAQKKGLPSVTACYLRSVLYQQIIIVLSENACVTQAWMRDILTEYNVYPKSRKVKEIGLDFCRDVGYINIYFFQLH